MRPFGLHISMARNLSNLPFLGTLAFLISISTSFFPVDSVVLSRGKPLDFRLRHQGSSAELPRHFGAFHPLNSTIEEKRGRYWALWTSFRPQNGVVSVVPFNLVSRNIGDSAGRNPRIYAVSLVPSFALAFLNQDIGRLVSYREINGRLPYLRRDDLDRYMKRQERGISPLTEDQMKEYVRENMEYDQAYLDRRDEAEDEGLKLMQTNRPQRTKEAVAFWNKYKHRFKPLETIEERDERIKELPITKINVNGTEIEVRIGTIGLPWYIDHANREKLEAAFDPQVWQANLKAKNRTHFYVNPYDDGVESEIPLAGFAAAYLPGVKVVEELHEVENYSYIIVMHDSNRNYTWAYQMTGKYDDSLLNPHEPLDSYILENGKVKFLEKKQSPPPRYRPYIPKDYFHPPLFPKQSYPRKTLDVGIFRQPMLDDLRIIKHKYLRPDERKPLNLKPPGPMGFHREEQNFWPTVSTRENPCGIPTTFRKLGTSDLIVSQVCLGTMTFGSTVDLENAHKLLDYAVDEFGINFLDTAELYPLPADAETHGLTESIIGKWLSNRGPEFRSKMVIATKIAGRSKDITWARGEGGTRLSKEQIIEATNSSLQRLETDYIDLLQFHWPDRYVPLQENGDYNQVFYDTENIKLQKDEIPIHEQLEAIAHLLARGKIRAWGLSNETPFGVLKYAQIAKQLKIPLPASVQLNYNLLCRNDVEKGFVELARPQNLGIGLLGYCPLAGGVLTGKYLHYMDATTSGRLLKYPSYMKRYRGSLAAKAVDEYYEIAMQYKLPNLTVMALSWVYSRPFINSTIIGFNDLWQLRENLYCMDRDFFITDLMERRINQIHWKWRDPIRIVQ